MRVKITKTPEPKSVSYSTPKGPRTGDQVNYGLYTSSTISIDPASYKQQPNAEDVRTNYPETDREDANVEVEKGEYILAPDLGSIYSVGGKKHYAGGTPIKAEPGAYVVSDFVQTNPDVMDLLGFDYDEKKDKGQTWAKFLKKNVDPKKYNGMAATINDKTQMRPVDPYSFNTAKIKMPEYQNLVSKIALGNELSKAFSGKQYSIPGVAIPGLEDIHPDVQNPEDAPMVKAQRGGPFYDETDPYGKANTAAGNITPTGLSNMFNRGADYLKSWEQIIPGISRLSNRDAQSKIYDYTLRNNPDAVAQMWQKYGLTNKGKQYADLTGMTRNGRFSSAPSPDQLRSLKKAYTDGLFGARQLDPNSITSNIVPGQGVDRSSTVPGLFPRPSSIPQVNTPSVTPEDTDSYIEPLQFPQVNRQSGVNPNAFDQIALLTAMSNPVNTYYPWAAKPQAAYIDPLFDEANYYPIQQAQAQRLASLNQTASPQIARAIASYQPDQVQGLISETQRARGNNLQTAMNVRGANAQTFNNLNNQLAQIDTNLYDKTVMTREQRDIARKLKTADTQRAAQNLVNNVQQMNYMQALTPQYGVSGPFWDKINFRGGRSLDDSSTGSGSGIPPTLTREQWINQNPGYASLAKDPKEAYRIDEAYNMYKHRQNTMLYRSARNFNANISNPLIMSGMMQGAGQQMAAPYIPDYDAYSGY